MRRVNAMDGIPRQICQGVGSLDRRVEGVLRLLERGLVYWKCLSDIDEGLLVFIEFNPSASYEGGSSFDTLGVTYRRER